VTIGRRLTFITLLSMALAVIPSVAALYWIARDHVLHSTTSLIFKDTSAALAPHLAHLERAETSLIRLAEIINAEMNKPARAEEIAELDAMVAADEHGVVRNRKELFDGRREAGVFIPADVELTEEVKRTKLRAMRVLTAFGQAALQHFDGVWFDQLNKTSVIFWRRNPDFIYTLPPDHDYTQTLWDQLASPGLNPGRIPQWTPAILETTVGTWVVSCVYPVDRDGQWFGIIGHDIALADLIAGLRASDVYRGTQHFLLDLDPDKNGRFDGEGAYVLAGPWQKALEDKAGDFKPDLTSEPTLQRLLWEPAAATAPAAGTATTAAATGLRQIAVGGVRYVAVSLEIPRLNWRYVRLVPESEILAPMQRLVYLLTALLVGMAALTVALMSASVRRLIVRPIQHLAVTVQAYGAGERERRARLDGKGEIVALGRALDDMADNIESATRALKDSEARYRTVVENVKEVIFQCDQEGRFLFLSPVWARMTGHAVDTSTGRPIADFLHPDDRPRKEADFARLLGGKRAQCSGEYRLIVHQGDYLWVDIHAQRAGANGHGDVYTGTIEDVTEDKFRRLVDGVLHRAEQQVLSHISVRGLCEHLCRWIAEVLDLPLVIIANLDHNGKPQLLGEGGDHRLPLAEMLAATNPELPDQQCALMRALTDGRTHREDLTAIDAPWARTMRANGLNTGLLLPLPHAPDRRHLIGFFSGSDTAFDAEGTARLARLAERAAGILISAGDHEWLRLQQTAMETAANAIFITDAAGRIEWVNRGFIDLTGYGLDEVLGQTPRLLKSGRQEEGFYRELWKAIAAGSVWSGEIVNRRKDGGLYVASETITPLRDEQGRVTRYVAVQMDITAQKAAEDRLEHMATHDTLTGLPNRELLRDRLRVSLAQARRRRTQVAVMFLDLDRFKFINDTLGYTEGDRLLREVARRLTAALRNEDTLARLGGDEFIVILPDIGAPIDAATVADKILGQMAAPFDLAGHEIRITTSIGISLYPQDGRRSETLLQHADAAMYHAKERGKNNYQFYTAALNARIVRRMNLERDLHQALDNGEFRLHYQPQADLETGTTFGVEALIRWEHPPGRLISPAEFIPVCEETGLIVPIGEWVLREACRQARAWMDAGLPPLSVAVNLSARQFLEPRLSERVRKALDDHNLPPERLDLELTESLMMQDLERSFAIMLHLRELGVKLSMDDFGTGYSSLSYLKRFPVATIKIDRSFVNGIPLDPDDTAIVRAIAAMARGLGIRVLAEGVETEDQKRFLWELGCHQYQGYLLAKPLPADELRAFIERQSAIPPAD